jgi:hypothetical protein
MPAARILDWVARRLAINIGSKAHGDADVPAGPLVWEDDGLGRVVINCNGALTATKSTAKLCQITDKNAVRL